MNYSNSNDTLNNFSLPATSYLDRFLDNVPVTPSCLVNTKNEDKMAILESWSIERMSPSHVELFHSSFLHSQIM